MRCGSREERQDDVAKKLVRFGLRFEVVADGKEGFCVGVTLAIVDVVL